MFNVFFFIRGFQAPNPNDSKEIEVKIFHTVYRLQYKNMAAKSIVSEIPCTYFSDVRNNPIYVGKTRAFTTKE